MRFLAAFVKHSLLPARSNETGVTTPEVAFDTRPMHRLEPGFENVDVSTQDENQSVLTEESADPSQSEPSGIESLKTELSDPTQETLEADVRVDVGENHQEPEEIEAVTPPEFFPLPSLDTEAYEFDSSGALEDKPYHSDITEDKNKDQKVEQKTEIPILEGNETQQQVNVPETAPIDTLKKPVEQKFQVEKIEGREDKTIIATSSIPLFDSSFDKKEVDVDVTDLELNLPNRLAVSDEVESDVTQSNTLTSSDRNSNHTNGGNNQIVTKLTSSNSNSESLQAVGSNSIPREELPAFREPKFTQKQTGIIPPKYKQANRPERNEPPQVKIGNINVLIDDQAAAKPKRSGTRSASSPSNPFGIRGL